MASSWKYKVRSLTHGVGTNLESPLLYPGTLTAIQNAAAAMAKAGA